MFTFHRSHNDFNDMSTTAVFLDIEKAFDIAWHPDMFKLISSFLSNTKFGA